MLPKANRLHEKRDFQKVLKNKQYIHSKYFTVATLFQDSGIFPRVGIIVANKVSKKAVERNRIKRVVRDVFYPNINKLSKGLSLVVIVKKEAVEKEPELLRKDVMFLIDKLR